MLSIRRQMPKPLSRDQRKIAYVSGRMHCRTFLDSRSPMGVPRILVIDCDRHRP